MNRRCDRQWLKDIEAAGADLRVLATGLDEAGFAALPVADRRSFRAVKNALSEICEAVQAVPPGMVVRHPSVDWRGWAALRDSVAHQYFRLDMVRFYITIFEELPVLLAAVTHELSRDRES